MKDSYHIALDLIAELIRQNRWLRECNDRQKTMLEEAAVDKSNREELLFSIQQRQQERDIEWLKEKIAKEDPPFKRSELEASGADDKIVMLPKTAFESGNHPVLESLLALGQISGISSGCCQDRESRPCAEQGSNDREIPGPALESGGTTGVEPVGAGGEPESPTNSKEPCVCGRTACPECNPHAVAPIGDLAEGCSVFNTPDVCQCASCKELQKACNCARCQALRNLHE